MGARLESALATHHIVPEMFFAPKSPVGLDILRKLNREERTSKVRFPKSTCKISDSLRVLYISYDGLAEPLGQSQILPYLERLSTQRIEFSLLTYEKESCREAKRERAELRKRLRKKGILWTHLQYHKTPTIPATLYDIFVGLAVGAVIVKRHRVQIVHARSYVPALIALILKQIFGIRVLFDMRHNIFRPGKI
jgi:hypothetical protein